jgi:hypothetical protein
MMLPLNININIVDVDLNINQKTFIIKWMQVLTI